jgi:hypothetical protein
MTKTKELLACNMLTFLVAVLVAPLALADQPAATNDNPFTITLPAGYGQFAKQAQTVKSPQGDIQTTNWVSKAPTGEAVVITLSQMPGKILDPEKMIATTRDSLLKSLNATLDSEEKRDAGDASARLLFHSAAAFFRSRFVVDDNRFYPVLYVGRSAEQRDQPAVGQLFESFKVAAPATPAPSAAAPAVAPAPVPAPAPVAAPAATTT